MVAHYIDVDQGAATLLEFPCGAVLIDAGGRGTSARNHLLGFLRNFFERRDDLGRRLAAVFITHAHSDHDGNLMPVAREFAVGGFIYNGKTDARITDMLEFADDPSPDIPVDDVTDQEIAASNGAGVTNGVIDPVRCAGTDPDIRVLSGGRSTNPGWRSEEFGNPNNHSLVIRVDFGQSSFLFTGDLERDGIEALLERYEGTARLNVDVYMVGHHGAINGTTDRFLEAMSPEIAVISAGQPNTHGQPRSAWDHGHPRLATIRLLEAAITRQRPPVQLRVFEQQESASRAHPLRDAIYSTSRDGDVTVRASAGGALVITTSQ